MARDFDPGGPVLFRELVEGMSLMITVPDRGTNTTCHI